jgi:hypothetical protein
MLFVRAVVIGAILLLVVLVSPIKRGVLSAARARREQAVAQMVELKLQLAKADVLDASAARYGFEEVGIQLRQEIMWQIPASAASIMTAYGASAEAANAVYEAIDDVVRQVLSDFCGWY